MNTMSTTSRSVALPRSLRRGGAAIAAVVLGALVLAAPANASFGIESFDGSVTNQDGSGATQAGSHPWAASTTIKFPTTTDSLGNVAPVGNVKNIDVALPPGFAGDPSATLKCTEEQLDTFNFATYTPNCPLESQVGIVSFTQATGATNLTTLILPVYNVVAPRGVPAQFGFLPFILPLRVRAFVRTGGDYGVTVSLRDISQITALVGMTLTLWGVPDDPGHDLDRGNFCIDNEVGAVCAQSGGRVSSALPKPFLTNPTDCSAGPVTTTMRADSWQDPGNFHTASFVSHLPDGTHAGVDGCDKVPFDPSIAVQPDVKTAYSPAGISVDVHLPPNDSPSGLGQGHLKKAVVTLPQGFAVSPSAADGLQACSPAQIGLDNASDPTCPDASKIGTVEVDTQLLPDPLKGSIFLAKQNDNPFGSLLAMYVSALDPVSGVRIKLAGKVDADPQTGQLTTTFDNNPQLPFSDLHLHFNGGPRAPLANPRSCGDKTVSADLTSWSGRTVQTTSTFAISGDGHGGPCPLPQFKPSVDAGLVNPVAGGSSSFVLRIQRQDVDNELKTISTTLPPGLLAKVAGVALCTDAQAAGGSCPAASQIGRVQVGAGPGASPLYITNGKAFLTEGYKGAPFGLDISVPAVAGPFDLGTVNVRAALRVDPKTAQVTVEADPMPRILKGIPLQIRDLRVIVDREGFMQSPTSCDEMTVTATIGSYAGDTASVPNRAQLADCAALAFAPRLTLQVTNKTQTKDGGHPGVDATVTQPLGEANLKQAVVALPLSLALDPENSQHVCDYDVALAVHGGAVPCPASTIVGSATAISPLVNRPLTGPVYLVQGIRFTSKGRRIRTLPTLLLPLRGELAIDLRASSSVDKANRLVTTFANIPDAAVSSFRLTITGGKRGIIVVTRNQDMCRPAPVVDNIFTTDIAGALNAADAQFTSHSGKLQDGPVKVRTPCVLSVFSRSYTSKSMSVKTGGFIGAGTLKVSGVGVRTTTRSIKGAGTDTATVTASLSTVGMAMRKAHKTLKIRLSFAAKGAKTLIASYPAAKKPAAKKP